MSSTPKSSSKIAEALAVAWELAGNPRLSDAAAQVVLAELARYPEAVVLRAIQRAGLEVSGRLSLAAIIERIDDGRPSADEAWAIVGTDDEARTFVATTEAMEARGCCADLLGRDDTGARMAFRRRYEEIVRENRARGVPVRWIASLGTDPAGREAPIRDAVAWGRLTEEEAGRLLPPPVHAAQCECPVCRSTKLLAPVQPLPATLPAGERPDPAAVRDLLAGLLRMTDPTRPPVR